MNMEHLVELELAGEMEVLGENLPECRWLTTWAMARPLDFVTTFCTDPTCFYIPHKFYMHRLYQLSFLFFYELNNVKGAQIRNPSVCHFFQSSVLSSVLRYCTKVRILLFHVCIKLSVVLVEFLCSILNSFVSIKTIHGRRVCKLSSGQFEGWCDVTQNKI
jgi:hypothetical protein